jgi:hypothetical protein
MHTLSRDLAELFLRGYEEGRTNYSVGDTRGERITYWDVVGAYGRQVGPITLGGAAHFIGGGTLVGSRLFDPRIDTADQDIEIDYAGVSAHGGSGYALDVGFAYQPREDVTMSGAVTNALASMRWSEDRRYRLVTLDRAMIDDSSPADLLDRYEASETAYDPGSVAANVAQIAEGLYESADLPPVARLGLAYTAPTRTQIALDWHHKLDAGKLADPWDQRVAVGVQQRLSIFGFSAGYSVGGEGGNMLTGGLTVGALDLGVARYQYSDLDGGRNRGLIASVGVGVRGR